jgi:predicted AlkP superfamily pyrophosphatase or phosphodiesterase
MRKVILLVVCVCCTSLFTTAQISTKPKLVVGLVIDQMRWDYLYKYADLYGTSGFKRLMKDGFNAENAMIPYMPTYTAPGHTCVYTGTVPAINGIVGNNWFDKITNKVAYCAEDTSVNALGVSANTKAGKMSPANLWTTTIADELRLSNNFKSKVIGIALKDRGAILPAGHSANAAYWYDGGKWITSTYYMTTMPEWVIKFNDKEIPKTAMSGSWSTLLPIEKYNLSTTDDKPYENNIKGEKTVTFPHLLNSIDAKDKYEAFKTTPFANTYTLDFAKATIENERLGKNNVADFLAVSLSSTDYIGHSFGPNSIEIQDTYLRLDKDIASFLNYLDVTLGKGNYTFFLTADHGAAHIPAFLNENKLPGGTFDEIEMTKGLSKSVEEKFAIKDAIRMVMNYQVYINNNSIAEQGKSVSDVKAFVLQKLIEKDFVTNAFELDKLAATTLPAVQKEMITNGYNPKRSGDIQFIVKPNYFDGGKKGTTHGLWNPYDAHIPCLFFGWGVKPGKTNRETYMTDIAPTIAAILKIQMPNGCVGKVITELVK